MAPRKQPTGPKLPPKPSLNDFVPKTSGETGALILASGAYGITKAITFGLDLANHYVAKVRRAKDLEAQVEAAEDKTGTNG